MITIDVTLIAYFCAYLQKIYFYKSTLTAIKTSSIVICSKLVLINKLQRIIQLFNSTIPAKKLI